MQVVKIYQSPLGALQLISKDDFIYSVMFVEAKKKPVEQIEESKNSCDAIDNCIAQLTEYFSNKRTTFDIPLKFEGTDFQNKVWTELCKIPFGETISYLKFAEKLGDVKAIRAAASANGNNKISIIVPCHRVIGSSGQLVGYAGDLWRKQWLLEHENTKGLQTEFRF